MQAPVPTRGVRVDAHRAGPEPQKYPHPNTLTGPVNGLPVRQQRTFQTVLWSAKATVVERLLHKAALANRLAKVTSTPRARALLYRQKTLAIVQLINCDAARIEELLVMRRLVTVLLTNGRRLHVPLDDLPPQMRRQLAMLVDRQAAA